MASLRGCRARVREDIRGSNHGQLDRVYDEVNDLKHTPGGLHSGRTVTFTEAVEAVDEILDLIEAWNGAGRPRTAR